ncbi:MAG: peptidoglycan DD-metalloendopeptidase family protein [Bacteroidia bacterium]
MRLRIITTLSGIFIIVAAYFVLFNEDNAQQLAPSAEDKIFEPECYHEPERIYGFNLDSFDVHHALVQRNENLSVILSSFNISSSLIHSLATGSREVFDVRKIVSGRPYCILTSKDSVQSASYFIYEKDPVNYVVCELSERGKITEFKKEVTTKERTAAGIIESSLYETLQDYDVSPAMAIKLSEVYAWSIDFYRLQKNDKFKVVFEQDYVEDKPVGLGRIKTALFEHAGKEFYAYSFEQNEGIDFFDENAESLRKAFLKAPLKFSRISSRYTMKRFHPVQKRWKAHLGTDYAAPTGTPIYTVGDGVITEASYNGGNGRYVKVRHNGTYTTQYLHMSKIANGIKPGKHVSQGEVIGYVGSTGLATGPHLCFRFWKNGRQVDPFREEIPPSEPVNPENTERYQQVMEAYNQQLDGIQYERKPAEQQELITTKDAAGKPRS